MKPILFEKDETTFLTRGLGTLSDAVSCQIKEERNNTYELELEYPIDGIHADLIIYGRIILAKHSVNGNEQPFRIYSITKPLAGTFIVNAEHVFYQHQQIPVAPFSATTASSALSQLKSNSMVTNPFNYWTDVTKQSQFSQDVPRTAREILGTVEGSILQQFGGEYEFDKYNVRLYSARGQDNGVTLRYGKNITDIQQEQNISETVTGILPYWTGQFTDEDTKEQVMYTVTGDIIYAQNASSFPVQKIAIEDVSSLFSAEEAAEEVTDTGVTVESIVTRVPTKAQVNELGQQLLDAKEFVAIPKVSISVSFVDLAQTEEYKDIAPLEEVNLCDIVTVYFEQLGISTSAKVVETVYDVLMERYDSITLGSPSDSLEAIIVEQQKFMGAIIEDGTRRRTRLEVMDGMIEAEVFERLNTDLVHSSYFQMTATQLATAILEKYGTTSNFANNILATARELLVEISAREDGDAYSISQIRQTAHSVDISVSNGYSTAGITVTIKDADGNTVDTATGTINMNGMVTFTNNNYTTTTYADSAASSAASSAVGTLQSNMANGSTTIDGGCIKTGNIYAYSGSASNPTYFTKIQTSDGNLSWKMAKSSMTSNGRLSFFSSPTGYSPYDYSIKINKSSSDDGSIYTQINAAYMIIRDGNEHVDLDYRSIQVTDDSSGYGTYIAYGQISVSNSGNGEITLKAEDSMNRVGLYDDTNAGWLIHARTTTVSGSSKRLAAIPYIRNYTMTSSSADAVYVNSNGTIGISSSSKRFKTSITYFDENELLSEDAVRSIRSFRPSIFRYNENVLENPEKDGYKYEIGLIAEDVNSTIGALGTIYEDDKESIPRNWQERPVIVLTLTLAQNNAKRIDELENLVASQNDRINKLEEQLQTLINERNCG